MVDQSKLSTYTNTTNQAHIGFITPLTTKGDKR